MVASVSGRCFLSAAILWFTTSAFADVALVVAGDLNGQQQVAFDAISKSIETAVGHRVSRVTPTVAARIDNDDTLLVAIGREALSQVVQANSKSPVLAVFVNQASFLSVLPRANPSKPSARVVSAIFSGPDPVKQLALAKVLFRDRASIAYITGMREQSSLDQWQRQAESMGLPLSIVMVEPSSTERDVITGALRASVIVLDKEAILRSRVDIGRLLLGALENGRKAIIGFGPDVTDAGGLATTYSDDQDIAQDVTKIVLNFEETKRLPSSHYPAKFKVHLNPFLLHRLDIDTISESEVENAINRILDSLPRGVSQ